MLEALDDDSHSKLTSSGERLEVKYLREKLENTERTEIEKTGTDTGTGTGNSRKRQEGPADLNLDNMNKKQSKTFDRPSTLQPDPLHFSAPSSFKGQNLSVQAPRVSSNPTEIRNSQQQVEPAHNQNQNSSNHAYAGSDSRSQSTGRTLTANTSSSSDTYDVGNYSRVDGEKSNHNQRAKNRNSVFT
jgi:hypothetical protein